ncbi:MAG: hypothetical protein IT275_02160 [Chitinophagales bacterium]|nr:hypothetical protein [Chitinophagales bacterium]
MLNVQTIKEKEIIIHQLQKTSDEELLHQIYQLLEARNKQVENPFSKKQLIERAKMSEQDIKDGNTTPLSELKNEIQEWQK